jgi:hypothetical protein
MFFLGLAGHCFGLMKVAINRRPGHASHVGDLLDGLLPRSPYG